MNNDLRSLITAGPSLGYAGKLVRRNSMGLTNTRYYRRGKFFWDERAESLEKQVLMPIEDRVEMGHHLPDLVPELQADPIYPPLMKKAFGDPEVTVERVAKSLAQFVRSIVSYQSRYDEGRVQVELVIDPFPQFHRPRKPWQGTVFSAWSMRFVSPA